MDEPKRKVAAAFLERLLSPQVGERFLLYGYRAHDGATSPLLTDAGPLPAVGARARRGPQVAAGAAKAGLNRSACSPSATAAATRRCDEARLKRVFTR
ncbi:hypothetical protein FDA94_34290 [Herbidospora galbida]|uniref:Uncharacterized protein n=1 Tax=Herbidospora galbida TaxID=2575442 RepID=A0A4U3LXZ4_9ACTN|nr:hypothetical protein [Herbidospora galbida]TKK81061.1 hypothetical protein FDA94_34290 [Herbidospora galbida]